MSQFCAMEKVPFAPARVLFAVSKRYVQITFTRSKSFIFRRVAAERTILL